MLDVSDVPADQSQWTTDLGAAIRAVSPEGWSVLAAAAALAAMFGLFGYLELMVIACSLVVAWLLAAVLALRGTAVSARRDVVPQRVKEGEPAAGLLTLVNKGRVRAPPGLAIEQFGEEEIPIALPSVAAGSEHIHSYPLDTSRRGRFRVGPLRLGRADPFRFFRSARIEGETGWLTVHPITYDVPPIQAGRVRDLDGVTRSRRAQGGVAFHYLREYVPGDDRRLIHWRSSAKTDTLMVRHNVVTHEPSVAVVLDTSPVYSDDEAFEDAVRIAASLVVSSVRYGFPTAFHTTSDYGGFIPAGGEGLTKLLDLLAAVGRVDTDRGLHHLLGLSGSMGRDTTLQVVTGVPSANQLSHISRVAGRFDAINTILVGDRFDRSAPSIKGAFVMRAPDAVTWVKAWKARFR